jgi:hypothetical protein
MTIDAVRGNVNGEDVIYLRFREPNEEGGDRIEMVALRLSQRDARNLITQLALLLPERSA